MNIAEYKAAVRRAKQIHGFIAITQKRRRAIKLSKAKALSLLHPRIDRVDGPIDAIWADGEKTILLVG